MGSTWLGCLASMFGELPVSACLVLGSQTHTTVLVSSVLASVFQDRHFVCRAISSASQCHLFKKQDFVFSLWPKLLIAVTTEKRGSHNLYVFWNKKRNALLKSNHFNNAGRSLDSVKCKYKKAFCMAWQIWELEPPRPSPWIMGLIHILHPLKMTLQRYFIM